MIQTIIQFTLLNLKQLLRVTILFILIAAPFMVLSIEYPTLFNSILKSLQYHSMGLRLCRWAIIILFVFSWPYLMMWMGKNATKEHFKQWKAERFRIAIWLILFELIISENIIFKLLHGG